MKHMIVAFACLSILAHAAAADAKASLARSATAEAKADRDHAAAVLAAKRALLADLERDRDAALDAKNLREANAADLLIRQTAAEVKALAAGGPAATRPATAVAAGAPALVIRSAAYGPGEGRMTDVTARVRERANGLTLDVLATSPDLGLKVEPGPKVLLIDLTWGGVPMRLELTSQHRLRITRPRE